MAGGQRTRQTGVPLRAEPLSPISGWADSSVSCEVCGQRMPLALIADHLTVAHGVDPQDIADAEVVEP